MTININYSKKSKKTSDNLVLFTDEDFKLKNLRKYLSTPEFSYINELLKNNDKKKNYLFLK